MRIQGCFLVYHGRETGLDVQLSRLAVQTRISEDVPTIDETVTSILQRGFQVYS